MIDDKRRESSFMSTIRKSILIAAVAIAQLLAGIPVNAGQCECTEHACACESQQTGHCCCFADSGSCCSRTEPTTGELESPTHSKHASVCTCGCTNRPVVPAVPSDQSPEHVTKDSVSLPSFAIADHCVSQPDKESAAAPSFFFFGLTERSVFGVWQI